jgi:hypothetical protein
MLGEGEQMYGEVEWTQARRLYGSGISKSAIAHRLGMSRTTVGRLLWLPAPPVRTQDSDTGDQRKGSGSGRNAGRRITVLPPITTPASAEQADRVVGALAVLLLAQLEGGRAHEQG